MFQPDPFIMKICWLAPMIFSLPPWKVLHIKICVCPRGWFVVHRLFLHIDKFDLLLLDYNTRFSPWQVKIRAILAHPDLDEPPDAFGRNNQKSWTDEKRKDGKDFFSLIHKCLSYNILQEVLQKKTTAALWLNWNRSVFSTIKPIRYTLR